MKKIRIIIYLIAGMFSLTAAFPKTNPAQQDQGQVVVTVLSQKGTESPATLLKQDLQLKVNGKASEITEWLPFRDQNSNLEMVLLIDSSARASLGSQFGEIAAFIQSLPPNAKVAIAYMNAGRAVMAGPFSANHDESVNELRIPGLTAGSSASPYFCLSDLAKHWPSTDHSARREVVLISDGVDNYGERFDLNDQYVDAAIDDSIRAGLVVYVIYWPDRGARDKSDSESFDGQNLMSQVTQATGGNGYWMGDAKPVSLSPYFDDIQLRLKNQYKLSFRSLLKGKPQIQSIQLKVNNPAIEVGTPQRVFITNSTGE